MTTLCAGVMACSMVGCGKDTSAGSPAGTDTTENPSITEPVAMVQGNWKVNQEFKQIVNDEEASIFLDALEKETFFSIPVAVLGTQVVSGTNYVYLCSDMADDGNYQSWAIAEIYNSLDGEKKLLAMTALNLDKIMTDGNTEDVKLLGGVTLKDNGDVDVSESESLNKEIKETLGKENYSAISMLGYTEAGDRWLILANAVDENKKPASIHAVTVEKKDGKGKMEIIDDKKIDLTFYLGGLAEGASTPEEGITISSGEETPAEEITEPVNAETNVEATEETVEPTPETAG